MEREGNSMISRNWRVEDYLNLKLSISSSDNDWNAAISFLSERFIERYFGVIDKLKNDPDGNGFAIMALNCLLIDAFYQFENGLEETNKNKKCYTAFLKRYMGSLFRNDEQALLFYQHIRCGILHSAQTKYGRQLTFGKNYAVEFFNSETNIRVDVIRFSEELYNYFQNYLYRLENGDTRSRENFLKKMQYICRR